MSRIPAALTAALLTASALSCLSMPVSAEEYVYGTMNIPYADFYKQELAISNNTHDVDAVSSATTNKWMMNGEGQLFEGTYHSEPNEDGSGQILGVTYPVAITQADLDALGENNYGFTASDSTPDAYKIVTVQDGAASFSAVQDASPENFTSEVKLSTASRYGDYEISLTLPENVGAVYGIVVKTAEGNSYGMVHEMNIWRAGTFSWSNGFVTTEVHGNTLAYECFDGLMGATISEITYIGLGGYYTVSPNLYIPVKFAGTLTAENAPVSAGKTSFTTEGFPDDFAKNYHVADGFTVTDGEITYSGVQPGSYTLTVSDANGKYADVSTSFVLSTADVPVQFDGEKLVAADGFSDADAANFIAKLSKVKVGEKEYNASGKGAVSIINADGTINKDATSGRGESAAPVFGGNGDYALTLTATGYDTPYSFTLTIGAAETTAAETTTAAADSTSLPKATTTGGTTTSAGTTVANSTTTVSSTASPKTGDAAAALPLAIAAAAAGAVLAVTRKKR